MKRTLLPMPKFNNPFDRENPRIFRSTKDWCCEGHGWLAWHDTPIQAWTLWCDKMREKRLELLSRHGYVPVIWRSARESSS